MTSAWTWYVVAITVVNRMLAEGGRRAIVSRVSTTACRSMRGSGFTLPSACGTPFTMRAVISLAALPMSIWPTAMSKGRPSSAAVRVRPLTACLVAV